MPPFVTIPREYASDYRTHRLTRQELFLLLWLRLQANPYGIATVELGSLAIDYLSKKSKNYVNKLLLELKRKRYIYYEERAGRRGSFEVHLDYWPIPHKETSGLPKIRRLNRYFQDGDEVRSTAPPEAQEVTEEHAKLESSTQRSKEIKNEVDALLMRFTSNPLVRAPYTDTDKEKEKNTNPSEPFKKVERNRNLNVSVFRPQTAEEEECLAIAQMLGEGDMAFLLGSKEKHGMGMLRRALAYCERLPDFGVAANKGAFFNKRLQEMINSDNP